MWRISCKQNHWYLALLLTRTPPIKTPSCILSIPGPKQKETGNYVWLNWSTCDKNTTGEKRLLTRHKTLGRSKAKWAFCLAHVGPLSTKGLKRIQKAMSENRTKCSHCSPGGHTNFCAQPSLFPQRRFDHLLKRSVKLLWLLRTRHWFKGHWRRISWPTLM